MFLLQAAYVLNKELEKRVVKKRMVEKRMVMMMLSLRRMVVEKWLVGV